MQNINKVWKNCCEAWSAQEDGHLAIISSGYNDTLYQTVVIDNNKIIKKLTEPADFFTDCIGHTIDSLIAHFKSRADFCEETLRNQRKEVFKTEGQLADTNGIINILNSFKE